MPMTAQGAAVPRRIAFRVDASPLMGGGHVMRCLTLADKLAHAGAKISFVSGMLPDNLAARIHACGHDRVAWPEAAKPWADKIPPHAAG